MTSLTVVFSGASPPHEDDAWAPGHGLALVLHGKIRASAWGCSDPDAWRGSGWTLACAREGEEIEVILAGRTDGD